MPDIVVGVVLLINGGLMSSAGGKKLQGAAQGGLAQAAMEQVLDTNHFFALRNGVDTKDDVYRMFGPPAKVERVYSFKGDIWTYRFLDNGNPRRAHVHIDPQGVVQKVMFTDESMYLREPHR